VASEAEKAQWQRCSPGGPAIQPIAEAFGAEFIAADGALDRVRMRQASFSDPAARARLESIIHPLVGQETARLEQFAEAAGAACVVFDVPLLVESRRWRKRVDRVLVVDCVPEIQISRVMSRSGLALDEIQKIIASQASRLDRLRAADIVLFNGGPSREQIAHEVKQLARRLGL
jgi:dephospho-CoA kinase